MKNTSLNLSLLMALTLSVSACGGGGDGKSSSPTPTSVSSVSSVAPSSSSVASSAASSIAISASSSSSSLSSSSSVVSSATIAENQIVTEYHTTHTIYNLENCGKSISLPNNTASVFGDYEPAKQNQVLPNMTGWTHTTNGKTNEWKNTKLSGADYSNPTHGKANSDCNDVDTLNMVLVKKIADWDHQHANGFESHLITKNIGFAQVDSIIVDLKINSARTSIPTQKQLIDTYSTYTTQNNITGLDSQKVNIGFTLYDGTNLGAADIIELDQALYADKWIRVAIKLSSIKFYSETNYVRTTKKPEDFANAIIKGLLVVGENKTGNVLRGNISNWNESVPESFKEMDVSIKKIEFLLK